MSAPIWTSKAKNWLWRSVALILAIGLISWATSWARAKFELESPEKVEMSCRDGYHVLPEGRSSFEVVVPPCGNNWTSWHYQPLKPKGPDWLVLHPSNVVELEYCLEDGSCQSGKFKPGDVVRVTSPITRFHARNTMREQTFINATILPRKGRKR